MKNKLANVPTITMGEATDIFIKQMFDTIATKGPSGMWYKNRVSDTHSYSVNVFDSVVIDNMTMKDGSNAASIKEYFNDRMEKITHDENGKLIQTGDPVQFSEFVHSAIDNNMTAYFNNTVDLYIKSAISDSIDKITLDIYDFIKRNSLDSIIPDISYEYGESSNTSPKYEVYRAVRYIIDTGSTSNMIRSDVLMILSNIRPHYEECKDGMSDTVSSKATIMMDLFNRVYLPKHISRIENYYMNSYLRGIVSMYASSEALKELDNIFYNNLALMHCKLSAALYYIITTDTANNSLIHIDGSEYGMKRLIPTTDKIIDDLDDDPITTIEF